MKLNFNLNEALNIGWKGMLTIFIGMPVIYGAILLLSLLKEKNEND